METVSLNILFIHLTYSSYIYQSIRYPACVEVVCELLLQRYGQLYSPDWLDSISGTLCVTFVLFHYIEHELKLNFNCHFCKSGIVEVEHYEVLLFLRSRANLENSSRNTYYIVYSLQAFQM